MMPRYPLEGSKKIETCSCACSASSGKTPGAPARSATGLAAGKGTRDDDALDFTGAFIDLRDFGVAEQFLDGEIPHVSIPAEQLHGLRRDPHRRLGREQFSHAGVGRDVFAAPYASMAKLFASETA